MAEEDTGQCALDFIERLAKGANWYLSAIELGPFGDGERLMVEAIAILKAAGRDVSELEEDNREGIDRVIALDRS